MNNTEVMAQIMFAFSKLPDDVRHDEDITEAFKCVIEMLQVEIKKEGD